MLISDLQLPVQTESPFHKLTSHYIDDLSQACDYIRSIDFSMQKYKMANDRFVTGWSMEKLDFIEPQYKFMLMLWRKYPGRVLPPSDWLFHRGARWGISYIFLQSFLQD